MLGVFNPASQPLYRTEPELPFPARLRGKNRDVPCSIYGEAWENWHREETDPQDYCGIRNRS